RSKGPFMVKRLVFQPKNDRSEDDHLHQPASEQYHHEELLAPAGGVVQPGDGGGGEEDPQNGGDECSPQARYPVNGCSDSEPEPANDDRNDDEGFEDPADQREDFGGADVGTGHAFPFAA